MNDHLPNVQDLLATRGAKRSLISMPNWMSPGTLTSASHTSIGTPEQTNLNLNEEPANT